jgi:hypothetical protein
MGYEDAALDGIPEIVSLLDQLNDFAPTVQKNASPVSVNYRFTPSEANINEALDNQEELFDPEAEQRNWNDFQEQSQLPFVEYIDLNSLAIDFNVPVVAVDCGVIRLGETEDGLIIALRGSIVSVLGNQTTVHLYRTGTIYLRNRDRLKILYAIGSQLGKPDIFVELRGNTATRIKSGVADDTQKYSDRFRSWFERILQRIAVKSVSNGLILLDGALTYNTIDTPTIFMKNLAEIADANSNALVGVSKQSRLLVGDRHVRSWLSESPNSICYRRLSPLMSDELRGRILGSTYAIRFSPMGLTYRVDISAIPGQDENEVIHALFGSCLIRGGYPDILVQAHTHSYFTSPNVTELQAECGARYSLKAEPEIDFGGIFGPFGGRFK